MCVEDIYIEVERTYKNVLMMSKCSSEDTDGTSLELGWTSIVKHITNDW